MRKLASIQKIVDIQPIVGADRIEMCQVLGWQCVCKKNEFKVGDLVVYCEIDSILPEKPEFEFLRERKFRIKTIKLKGQISQGIVFPVSILPNPFNHFEDEDVTDLIGITKYDPQLQEEKSMAAANAPKSKINKFLMNFAIYRFFYFKLNRKNKGWPSWIAKTDEERIESCLSVLINNADKQWYVTEKLDGCSATYFVDSERKFAIPHLVFGVCSRNIRLSKKDNSHYWKIVEKNNIDKKLLSLKKKGIVVQGEICGPKIQDNKYKLEEIDLYVFNVIDNGRKYNHEQMKDFCDKHGFKIVSILNDNWILSHKNNDRKIIMEEITKMSVGKSVLNKDIWREGLVFRLVENPDISFKKINPEFLLKYGQ